MGTSGAETSWLEYLYPRLIDPDSGLAYTVVKKEGLVFDTAWTNASVNETGSLDLGNGYEMVTNQIPVEVDAKFVQLEVERVD